jgi:hypothetical protein
MPRLHRAILVLLAILPFAAAAQDQGPVPGSLALLLDDASPKASRDPERGAQALKTMAASFLRFAKLTAMDQDSVDKAQDRQFFLRTVDLSSLEDLAAIGDKLKVQALATASLSVANGFSSLALRLYDMDGDKLVAEKSSSGPEADLTKQIEAAVAALSGAWMARPKPVAPPPAPAAAAAPTGSAAPAQAAAPSPAKAASTPPAQGSPAGSAKAGSAKAAPAKAAAAKPGTMPPVYAPGSAQPKPPAEPTDLAVLIGYESVVNMSIELEGSRASWPLAFGFEVAYGRMDPFAYPEDLVSFSAIGRWWPVSGRDKKGMYLSLSAGLTKNIPGEVLVGPFRFALGWSGQFEPGTAGLRLARPLRLQPEIGFTWTSGPTNMSRGIVGFLPFAGLRFRI